MDTTNFRDLSVEEFDTTTLLQHANEQAIQRRYEDFFIVDVDGHHYETESFKPDLRIHRRSGDARPGEVSGLRRRRHHRRRPAAIRSSAAASRAIPARRNEKTPPGTASRHRADASAGWMRSASTSSACSRRRCWGSALRRASMSRSRWRAPTIAGSASEVLAHEPRIRSSLYLPMNDPEAGLQDGRRNSPAAKASSASPSSRRATSRFTTTPT